MVSIIKNQLLKHLSRYTKNLSSDKINLSTFRGEGELSNLQLDENVLTDLLELPSWLRLTSAWCNHVSFRISWTKLKSVPITLVLDEVNIAIETCEEARNSGGPTSPASSTSSSIQALSIAQGKYSFIHKVVDGITIIVNTVNVKFKSQAFTASVQMSRIRVESKTPKWLHSNDLRITRLKDPQKGIVLIFKEVSWQTVRIEASSTQDITLTPLRLLTNQAKCRITIRKRLSDCSVLASRLVIILDDLLWVLTDSQLKAALHFVDSLSGLIKAATHATQKTKAQKKLETLPEYQALIAQQQSRQLGVNPTSPAQKNFNSFDVRETSYHFFSQRIDLHLCDDEGAEGRSSHPELRNGGALQISVQAFQVDYYPYHLAKSDRSHWAKYKEANIPPALWLEQSLNVFREAVLNLSQPNRPPTHAPLERTPVSPPSQLNYQQSPINSGQMTPSGTGVANSQRSSISGTAAALAAATTNKTILDNMAKLMSACVVLRIEDFTLYRVTTAGKKQMPKEFIAGDKDKYSMPPEMPIVHAEFTYFYYPGDFIFPLPPSKIFIYINPIQIHFDLCSILWFNSFALNLHESLLKTNVINESKQQQTPSSIKNEPSFMYMDVKLEVIMPRVIIESSIEPIPAQKDRPKQMQIQISRFALTNIREMGSSRADLAQALHSLQEGSLVFGTGFPSIEGDLCIVTDRILSHVAASDVPNIQSAVGIDDITTAAFNSATLNTNTTINNLTRYAMWSEPRDVWCIKFDPIWIDFLGARSLGQNKSIPFIDAVPITLWLHESSSLQSDNNLDFKEQQQQYNQDKSTKTINPLDFANSNNIHSSNSNSNFSSQCSINTTIDNKQYNTISNSKDIQDELLNLHVIAHVSNLVSVQIDHYQYLFLLRLSEELQELTTFLSLDAERISQMEKSKKSIVFGCVIPQIEVTVVMPSPTPGKESSGGDAESVLPDSASLMSTNITWPTPPPSDHVKNSNINSFGNIETPSTPITATTTATCVSTQQQQQQQQFDEFSLSYTLNPNTQGNNVQIQNNTIPVPNKDQMESSLYSQGQSSSSTTGIVSAMSTSMTTASSSVSSRGGGGSGSANKSRNSVTDSAISKEINMGLLSMKKGFTSFMTSIDSALKTGTSGTIGSDDVSDTFSIYSDISSDSENYAIVMADDKTADCMDVMFRLNPFTTDSNLKVSPVEVASEVCEEPNYKTNMSSPSEPSEGSTWRRRDLVSMATFRLTTVEVIRQNQGYSSSLRLQVSALSCDECGAIPWDELQTAHQQPAKTKFEARCRAWNIAPYNPEAPPCIQLRLEETLNPPKNLCNLTDIDKNVIKSWFEHDIDIRVKDLTLDLTMSTAIGLGDFSEDEIIAKPLPLKILLESVKLNLIEDRPPVNITSPGPVPINLSIGKMIMKRDTDGIVHIQPLDNDNDYDASTATSKKTTSETKNIVENSKNLTGNNGEYKKEKLHRNKDRDKEILSLQLIMQQLKLENDNLKKQLNTTNETSENYRIKIKQENEVLRTYLKAAQDDISTLLEEKKTLLDSIRLLQQQLTAFELNKKKDGNR